MDEYVNTILPNDFHHDAEDENGQLPGTLHESQNQILDDTEVVEVEERDEGEVEGDEEYGYEPAAKRRGGTSGRGITGSGEGSGSRPEEKREKQKMLNRKAAEKSRSKKREELTTLELTVHNIQEENQRLRLHLSSLLAQQRPTNVSEDPIIPPQATTSPSQISAIDYTALSKLQAELSVAKKQLLDRELELARIRNANNGITIPQSSEEVEELRRRILNSSSSLTSLQAEAKSLHSLVGHLRDERDDLARRRVVVTRELEARRALRDVVDQPGVPGGTHGAVGVERALLDMRGWVDNAVKTWEMTSILPAPRDIDEESMARLASLAGDV